MITIETVVLWAAVGFYALGSAGFIGGLIFARPGVERAALWIAGAGWVAHTAGIAVRWVRTGRGPYLGFHEVASLLAWITVALLLWLAWQHPGLRVVGVAVLPIAFLIMGGALLVSRESAPISGALVSLWLFVHVLFANLAYGAYVAAFMLSVAYLVRERGADASGARSGRLALLFERLPGQEVLDSLTFRFVGAGFIFQGIMLASGAIWANQAWGRYWGWDAIETWSLIAWAIYALYLHLRLTLGWSGRRAAWVAVIALPVIVFSLLGVPLVYDSIHGAYLYT